MRSKKLSLGLASVFATFALATLMTATPAPAQTYTLLYGFTASDNIGAGPYDGMIKDSSGNLYGTTSGGGTKGDGTVFLLVPPATVGGAWTENVLYNFAGLTDGGAPVGGLTFDSAGNLYGTTYRYGNPTYAGGTVFELSPPSATGGDWTYTVLYTFGDSGSSDGLYPWGNLVFDSAGNLFGVTNGGGSGDKTFCGIDGCGTAYKLTAPVAPGGAWTETVIYNFAPSGAPDGYGPNDVLFGAGRALYGTAGLGGPHGGGTFFMLTPPAGGSGAWTERNLYYFGNYKSAGASYPNDITPGPGGIYFATSQAGGSKEEGTVFELSKSSSGTWTSTVLYSFQGSGTDGCTPVAGVTLGGGENLFGTTTFCGSESQGTVFKLKPPTGTGAWTELILHNFTESDGSDPFGNLLLSGGTLYGTTEYGGPGGTSAAGVAFSVVP